VTSVADASLLLYTHADCLRHDPGAGHPEHPRRLSAVLEALHAAFPDQLDWREAPLATEESLARAHDRALIERLRQLAPTSGHARIDEDTALSPPSLAAAGRAAGAVCAAVDAVLAGPVHRAFCAVRPPGHHATRAQAMGFCLYNSVAIGTLHALDARGLQRVAVLDFDVHHGNGTEDILGADPRVLFASTHQSPLYPGTGQPATADRQREVHNLTLPPRAGSTAFRAAWETDILPAVAAFGPQLIVVSAGFDAHRLDPLADLELEAADYGWIGERIAGLATALGDVPIVAALEGGYSLTALAASSRAFVGALLAVRAPALTDLQ
jgi:acetoin utilization deacetylase AcuC-like enzyme